MNRKVVHELKTKHQHLENHWASTPCMNLDPQQSERSYKLHLGRMMDLYANHKMAVNNSKPIPSGRKPSPMNILYGLNGIRSMDALLGSEEKIAKREKSFDNRITLPANMDRNKSKFLRPSSAPITQEPPFVASTKTVPQKKKRIYRRCFDSGMAEDELVIRGLYRFDEYQTKVYEDFVQMLSQFDHYDSVNILADALTDASSTAGLDDFTGSLIDDHLR